LIFHGTTFKCIIFAGKFLWQLFVRFLFHNGRIALINLGNFFLFSLNAGNSFSYLFSLQLTAEHESLNAFFKTSPQRQKQNYAEVLPYDLLSFDSSQIEMYCV